LTRLAEALFLLCLVAAPWPYGSSLDVARYALAAVLFVAAGLWALAQARGGRGLPFLAPPAAGLPLLALLQIAWGGSAARFWTAEAFLLLAAMLLTTCFWSERSRHHAGANHLAWTVLALCAAQSVFGAVQWSRGPDQIYGRLSPIVTTPFGSYVNHNHFAGLVAMGTLVAVGLVLGRVREGRGLTPATAGLGGLALALVASQAASRSRGGLLALAGGLGVLAALSNLVHRNEHGGSTRRGIAVAAVMLLAFGLAVVPAGSRRHLATLLAGPSDLSGQYRLDVAAGTLRLALSRPLTGSGLGAFADAFPEFKRGHGELRTTHAESDVLELLAEAGLAGVLLTAWLASAVVRGFRNRQERSRDVARNSLAAGALAAVGALLVHSLFDFNLRLPANALVFASLLGLAAAPREELPGWGGRKASLAVGAMALLLSAAAGWRALGALQLERALSASAAPARIAALDAVLARHATLDAGFRARGLAWRDWPDRAAGAALPRRMRAERDLRQALELRPRWGEVWSELGWTLFVGGDSARAGEAFTQAVALDPTHLGIGAARAEFLARTSGPAAGVEELKRLRAANPQWPAASATALARRWTQDRALLDALDRAR
jgi:tetratricopeptide (TPR) repeat protein